MGRAQLERRVVRQFNMLPDYGVLCPLPSFSSRREDCFLRLLSDSLQYSLVDCYLVLCPGRVLAHVLYLFRVE